MPSTSTLPEVCQSSSNPRVKQDKAQHIKNLMDAFENDQSNDALHAELVEYSRDQTLPKDILYQLMALV